MMKLLTKARAIALANSKALFEGCAHLKKKEESAQYANSPRLLNKKELISAVESIFYVTTLFIMSPGL